MRLLKPLEKIIKRWFFALSGSFLKKGRTDFKAIDPHSIKRVLFIRPEKLGDMVISLPVFHNLKKMFPHLELYILGSPRSEAVIRRDNRFAAVFLYTKNIFKDWSTVRKVRKLKIDVVADMVCDDSVTSLYLTQLCSATASRIGLGKNRHKKFYDFNYLYRTGDSSHVVDNTLKLLTAFGIDTALLERHIPPDIEAAYFDTAERFITSLNGSDSSYLIGLNISAGRPSRVWPAEKNEALIRLLLDKYRTGQIIISSDPSERDKAMALAGKFERRVDVIPPGLNLLEVSAIISKMKILITPDTSLVHIARSFMVPVVGLYTRFAKNFELWRPFNQKGGAVISGNDYNIYDIEVTELFEEVVRLMPEECQ